LGKGIMFSVRPSVCYQSGEHDILKMNKPILLQIGKVVFAVRGWGWGGQSSRSHNAEVRVFYFTTNKGISLIKCRLLKLSTVSSTSLKSLASL